MDIGLTALAIAFGVNLLFFLPAQRKQTDRLTDISYALSFAVIAIVCFGLSTRQPLHFMILLAILLWAFRLGSFLFTRINRTKRDKRFDGIRENSRRFLNFWLLQAVSVFVISLPAILLWGTPDVVTATSAYVGIAVFALGLLIETVSDLQKTKFGSRDKNRYRWIDQGIWQLSRHPNYLGEILVWVGIYIAVFEALGTGGARLVAAIGPLFIAVLLIFVSGVPLLERSADKKWGHLNGYQVYKKNTPVLIPNFRSFKRFMKNPA